MNELQAFKINFTDSNMFTLRYQSLKPKKISGQQIRIPLKKAAQ